MGTLRADTITDGAGTGAPNFTQGLQLAGTLLDTQVLWQAITIAAVATASTNNVFATNLVVGKTYRLTFHLDSGNVGSTAQKYTDIQIRNSATTGNALFGMAVLAQVTSGNFDLWAMRATRSFIFTALDNNLNMFVNVLSGTNAGGAALIEQLPNHAAGSFA